MPHFIKVNFTLILIVFASSELLPRDVIPKEYTLQILTILDEAKDDSFSFKGSVLIHVSYQIYLRETSISMREHDSSDKMRLTHRQNHAAL